MLTIDGSSGEGGGQILRTTLALAAIAGTPVRLVRIRARRRRPGLRPQHLAAVRAAAAICAAELEGAALDAQELTFAPGPLRGGEHRFDVGTAGSATLVLETVLWPLLRAQEPSRLHLCGGTHNPLAPPFEFVERVLAPRVAELGGGLALSLDRCGFYPAGGGAFSARVTPAPRLAPLDLSRAPGPYEGCRATALLARLPRHVGRRELKVVERAAALSPARGELREVASSGPGNALLIELVRGGCTCELVSGFGERGVRAETVARRAVAAARRFLAADVPVGEHLADQLIIPLALAGGGSLRTLPLTEHTRTNIAVVEKLLPVRFRVTEERDSAVRVEVVA